MKQLEQLYFTAHEAALSKKFIHPNRYLFPMEIASIHLAIKDVENFVFRDNLFLLEDITQEYDTSPEVLRVEKNYLEKLFVVYQLPKEIVPRERYNNKDFMSLLTAIRKDEMRYFFIEDIFLESQETNNYLKHLLFCKKNFSA